MKICTSPDSNLDINIMKEIIVKNHIWGTQGMVYKKARWQDCKILCGLFCDTFSSAYKGLHYSRVGFHLKGIICFIYISRPLITHLGITGIINSFAVSTNEWLEVVGMYAQLLSHAQHFATQWTITHQDPLSMEFFRQDYWSGLPFPTPGYLPNPGIERTLLASPALAGRFFTTAPPGWKLGYSFLL